MSQDIYDDVTPIPAGGTSGGAPPVASPPSSQPASPQQVNGQAGAQAPAPAETKGVSDADFASLHDDVEEVDPNASVADAPPPVPLGYYPIKLKVVKDHATLPYGTTRLPGIAKKTDDGKGLKSIRIDMEPTIAEEASDFDKRFLARIFGSTAIFSGTSWADDIVKACNGGKLPYGEKRTHAQAWAALAMALQKEPVVGAEVDWKLTPEGKNDEGGYDKDFIKSAHSSAWPKKADGTPVVIDADPVSKKPARLQAFVKRVFPLAQLPQLRAMKPGAAGKTSGGTSSQGAGATAPTAPAMVD